MTAAAPHFVLYSEALPSDARSAAAGGRWRFVLEAAGGGTCLEAADDEADATSERLELLAIVRGLEALDAPSRVTLASPSRTVRRSLRYGLEQWRENDWHWERYGKLTPVKNGDLWRRIDRAMSIHNVECQAPQLDGADDLAPPPTAEPGVHVVLGRRNVAGRRIRIDGAARRQRPPRPQPHSWLAAFWHWLFAVTARR